MKLKVSISFDYKFTGEKLSEGATGDLVSYITDFYSSLKRNFGVENLKIEIEEADAR